MGDSYREALMITLKKFFTRIEWDISIFVIYMNLGKNLYLFFSVQQQCPARVQAVIKRPLSVDLTTENKRPRICVDSGSYLSVWNFRAKDEYPGRGGGRGKFFGK